MQTIIDQLIADFHEQELPRMTPKQARLPWLPGKIDTVIGMRRSGNTWFLYISRQAQSVKMIFTFRA
ncbi:hypothetical protein [Desulfonatronospira sp.]|uniref:hypothetical protein n=1 Tax=Desulfonatronospira sp. TaxID=1962951 RepID=UPI0025BB4408|nr:hypothetical protein [Desulfonatronospira sp.]